jgi:hypothetical protein
MGRYRLSQTEVFRDFLFYQLTSLFCFFDILVMRDEDILKFHKKEREYFLVNMPDQSVRPMAAKAV